MDSIKLQKCIAHINAAERLLAELIRENADTDELCKVNKELQQIKRRMISKEERVLAQLRKMGIFSHLKGYYFLKTAILLYAKGEHKIMNIYKSIAVTYKTEYIRVEKNIRHAIEICCESCWKEEVRKIFGSEALQTKIKNREFIARLAEMLNNGEI